MEGLIQLVADSFIRHGIESPAMGEAPTIHPAGPTPATALTEHNHRRSTESDPAP